MEEDLAWREALKSMEYHLKMIALILYQIEPVMMELYMCMMRQTLTCVQLIPYGMQHGQLNAFWVPCLYTILLVYLAAISFEDS